MTRIRELRKADEMQDEILTFPFHYDILTPKVVACSCSYLLSVKGKGPLRVLFPFSRSSSVRRFSEVPGESARPVLLL